jgi:hypothetical protein
MRTIKLLFLNLLPVVFAQFILYFLWTLEQKSDKGGGVPVLQLFVDIGLPLLLIKYNYCFALKNKQKGFIINIFLIIIASILGHGLSYLNWGITTGYLTNPDLKTIGIVQFEVIISLLLIIIVGYMTHRTLQKKLDK